MEVDAWRQRDSDAIDADLCIIGAGPAGLAVAHEFCGSDTRVVVLESGGREFDRRAQALNEAEVIGSAYGDVAQTRQRQLGGTVNAWNSAVDGETAAKFVPLDPIDFRERPGLALCGWPFGASELEPYYRRAHRLCGLGPFDYRAASWRSAGREPLPLDGALLTTGVYQFATDAPFLKGIPEALSAAPNVTLLTHATALEFITDAPAQRVQAVRVARPDAPAAVVRAKRFVLAGGAIENARLLLASNGTSPGGLGNRHGWVGRCFMEHPRDYALRLVPARSDWFDEIRFYDQHRAADGTPILGRLALRDEAMQAHDLLNASVTMLPSGAPESARAAGWGARLGRRLQRLAAGRGAAARDPAGTSSYPRGGAGWSEDAQRRRNFTFVRLLVNLEQAPHADNRVVLSDRLDRLGARRALIHWQWRAQEQARLERLHALLTRELEGAGLGRVQRVAQSMPDPRAHHHAGTTRMHDDPRLGVVDRDGRVHDIDNLFVAGASVFPSAGYANPTLTIVAMALRLADRLRAA